MQNPHPSAFSFVMRATYLALRRRRIRRKTDVVIDEYSAGWREYDGYLQRAEKLEDWMRVPGVEDRLAYFNVDSSLQWAPFDSAGYYRGQLLSAIERHFPEAKSVTEFGCGVGRNLLYLKTRLPALAAYGYELCQPGVDTGNAAAAKFGFDIPYAKLDYLKDPADHYVHPVTDIGFTMFSLEQLPAGCETAVANMLSHVRQGLIHLEPVPENYPASWRGVVGRLDHWKAGYLSGFDAAVRRVGGVDISVEPLTSSHNPMMFPSLYVLRKRNV